MDMSVSGSERNEGRPALVKLLTCKRVLRTKSVVFICALTDWLVLVLLVCRHARLVVSA